jgi:transposase
MSKTTNKFAPEVRERAVRMVFDHERDHPSRWSAVVSIAEKIGCMPQTLHEWLKKAEINSGKRAGVPTDVADKVKALERESRPIGAARRASPPHRSAGVETVLVNSQGNAWSGDGLSGQFNRVRDAAGVAHIDPDTKQLRSKHLHDPRGTFCTYLMIETDLGNEEIADIMAWSPQKVAQIRKVYVDQSRLIVAIGKRIERSSVNRTVNSER